MYPNEKRLLQAFAATFFCWEETMKNSFEKVAGCNEMLNAFVAKLMMSSTRANAIFVLSGTRARRYIFST